MFMGILFWYLFMVCFCLLVDMGIEQSQPDPDVIMMSPQRKGPQLALPPAVTS